MSTDDLALRVAAAIHDFNELVTQLGAGVRGPLPWQRQLVAHLDGLAGLLQILRMSVLLERPGAEVCDAAFVLLEHTRRARLALAGTRADITARIALQLASNLAFTIHAVLRQQALAEDDASPAPQAR